MRNTTTAIINGKYILEDKIIEDKILFFDTQIIDIVDDIMMTDNDKIEIIDAKGAYVSAGFIDLHIHGSGGADVMDATPEALETLSSTLPQTGTTSFLATTMTMSTQDIDNALQNIQHYSQSVTGAKVLGVHLEGPFINPSKHGAQDKTYVQAANFGLIENYIDIVKMITLAPEEEGAKDFVKQMTKRYPHIILSAGHSNASYEEARKSFTWGISHVTHLFNAMPSYHHRSPGLVGAVFDSDVTCDIIADLVHTHPSTLALTHQLKGDKLILITDAMRAGCMQCGTYDLGGRRVDVSEGKALLEDGTLAGSVLKMNQAMANMIKYTSMTVLDVVKSVTIVPAEKLGVPKGRLKVGYDADIVIFDENFSIITTIVGGEVKYKR
ncbi:MAG TPA: N-acetylglucosamine-6-phosphate deacetylase [Epsilonproteobacteria bacterium]|nr:N-acetylglucosamine-6-phosphate deacetylase [Campylobacterota bacterium]